MITIAWLNIKEIDENLFTKKYVANCLDCTFCNDLCCSYGCPMDWSEIKRVLYYANQLEAELEIPSSMWFEDSIEINEDYPSGRVMRTKVYDGKCVFYKKGTRGCSLHRFGLEKGIDVHMLKPMVCCLFPITWEKERIHASEFLDELPCRDKGISIFEAQKNEMRIYLGDELVTELERKQHK